MVKSVVVDGEAARSGGGHCIVDAVEPSHAAKEVAADAGQREEDIDGPQPFGVGAEFGMQFGAEWSCGFGSKHLHASTYHRG